MDKKHSSWKLNQTLKRKGYIYYVGNGDYFTITDDKGAILYYEFEKETGLAILKNVIANYYQCTHSIYQDIKGYNFNITYRQGTPDLLVETRNLRHSNRAIIDEMP